MDLNRATETHDGSTTPIRPLLKSLVYIFVKRAKDYFFAIFLGDMLEWLRDSRGNVPIVEQ